MNSTYARGRRFAAATLFTLIGAAVLAPQASAKVDNVKAPENEGKYPCAFHCLITAKLSGADATEPVTFSVNGKEIGTATPISDKGNRGDVTASIEWAAPANGEYVITAAQGSDGKPKSVNYTVNVNVAETSRKK